VSDNVTKLIKAEINTDEDGDAEKLFSDIDRITLIGLIFETASGLRHNLSGTVECEIGVGGQSFEIMIRLLRTPSYRLRMTDLAAQTGLSPSGLSRAVDKLVEAGHVRREDCTQDRRGSYATLTELGIRQAEIALIKHKQDIDSLLFGVLRPQEEEKLVKLLTKLRNRVYPNAVVGAEA
jgi:DNA-binding MarR family transcriptional regulator